MSSTSNQTESICTKASRRSRSDPAGIRHRLNKSLFVPNVFIMQLVQAVGVLAIVWALFVGNISAKWWILAASAYFMTSCVGMSITVHRSLAHKAIRLIYPLEIVFSLFGAMGATGSPLGWVAIHRSHHAYADTSNDPHSPHRIGWKLLFLGSKPLFEWWRVRDILRDPFQRLLHRYYLLILVGWAAVLYIIHPLALVFGFLIPAAAQFTVTNLSTFLGHYWGYRNFETDDKSKNNALIAAIAWGEGWHNNHHHNPKNWTTNYRPWEIDISAFIIRLLALIGGIRRESFQN